MPSKIGVRIVSTPLFATSAQLRHKLNSADLNESFHKPVGDHAGTSRTVGLLSLSPRRVGSEK